MTARVGVTLWIGYIAIAGRIGFEYFRATADSYAVLAFFEFDAIGDNISPLGIFPVADVFDGRPVGVASVVVTMVLATGIVPILV